MIDLAKCACNDLSVETLEYPEITIPEQGLKKLKLLDFLSFMINMHCKVLLSCSDKLSWNFMRLHACSDKLMELQLSSLVNSGNSIP